MLHHDTQTAEGADPGRWILFYILEDAEHQVHTGDLEDPPAVAVVAIS